jgi:hypothetical protein
MAGHIIELRHCIQLQIITIISTKSRFMDCIFRETAKIKVHPSNMSRKDYICLSMPWKSLIFSLNK